MECLITFLALKDPNQEDQDQLQRVQQELVSSMAIQNEWKNKCEDAIQLSEYIRLRYQNAENLREHSHHEGELRVHGLLQALQEAEQEKEYQIKSRL